MFYKYFVEVLAMMFVVFVFLTTQNPLATGAAYALSLLLMQPITSSGLNPAITIAMASLGKVPINEILPLVLAQVFGGLVALEIYKRFQM